MDLKQYFRKVRELELTLREPYPIVVSLETADGGKPGILSEVSRLVAARLIIEGRALLATDLERELYRDQQVAAKINAEKAELAKRVQVAIISESDLRPSVPVKKSEDESLSGK